MNPKLLKTFLAVARLQNATRAAEEVNLAQSSVSDQIQSLETELGASLFHRSPQGLRLSAAGEVLLDYAAEIIALTDEARIAVQAAEASQPLMLRVGALETIAATRLPQIAAGLQQSFSQVRLQIQVCGSSDLRQKVLDGQVDAALCFDTGFVDQRLVKRLIFIEPMTLIARPDESNRIPGRLEALGAQRFVTTERGCVYRALFERVFEDAGLSLPEIAIEAGSIAGIAKLVAAGAGYAFVPRIAVQDALERGDVREVEWVGSACAAELVMIWRRRRVQSPALSLLLKAVAGLDEAAKSADDRLQHEEHSPS